MPASRLLAWLTAASAFLLAGCGDPYAGREPVSGTVTLKGEPLKDAIIQFQPLGGQDTVGGCNVDGGKFELAKEHGLKPGKYLVRITAGDGVTPASRNEEDVAGPGGNTNIVSEDRIPPEWSDQSKQEVEVKAGGKNEFTFAIPNVREVKKKKPAAKR